MSFCSGIELTNSLMLNNFFVRDMLLNSTKIPGNMGEKGPGRSPRDRAALNT